MLFYLKRYPLLEIVVTIAFASIGIWGMKHWDLGVGARPTFQAILWGVAGTAWLVIWNGAVQQGYQLFKGRDYAESLTRSLAKEFDGATWIQILLGGVTAACGEEVFFRGFVQGVWGWPASVLLFGLAHWGRRDIRIVSLWSFAQGFWLCMVYRASGNLLSPMVAHGLFDIGGFLYFRSFMAARKAAA